MAIALFDMDNTLIDGDTPSLWLDFLIEQGHMSDDARQAKDKFQRDYAAGDLNFDDYILFELSPQAKLDMALLESLRHEFASQILRRSITDNARAWVSRHQNLGDTCLLVTTTNRFLAEPVAQAFGIRHVLATEPAMREGRFTGHYEGTACFGGGKVLRAKAWCQQHNETAEGSHCYSDSINDVPLLEWAEHATVVDPDEQLAEIAQKRGWPVLSKHGAESGNML